MKICSYTMTVDTGFAPNPFHGCCTLAACTPNHQGAKLEQGDWIAGFFTDDRGLPYLVYAMQLELPRIGYDDYYHADRFQKKKPCSAGPAEYRCGDNIYHRDANGKWVRDWSPYHQDACSMEQDTRRAIVYIGSVYTYLGEKAYCNPLPDKLRSVRNSRGIKYTKEDDPLFARYRHWLEVKPRGVQGYPRDFNAGGICSSCGTGGSGPFSKGA